MDLSNLNKDDKGKVPKSEKKKEELKVNFRPEYKGKFKNEQGLDRKLRIKSCKTCNGDPETSDLNLPGFEGTKCNICFEVVNYRKI